MKRRFLPHHYTLLATVVVCMLWTSSAFAQAIAPKVMILFDTSGSMLWDTNGNATRGDGSVDHPGLDTDGDGQSNDSRLFLAKEAIRDILIEGGADVEFGLMRFHQTEGTNFGVSLDSGGNPAWYQSPINYDGWDSCDSVGADVLVEIGENNDADILSWMDGVENFPSNKELRGSGWTPLPLALNRVEDNFQGTVIPGDDQSDCRSYYVILLTDGVRQCPSATPFRDGVAAAASLRSVTVGGRTHDIKTFVVGFGPGVNGSAELNAMARAAGTAINAQGAIDLVDGQALFATNAQRLREQLEEVLINIVPEELCDGADNDCDGGVDEGFAGVGQTCSAGIGECQVTGQTVCSESGTAVICNAVADTASPEVCDGADNNCNGVADEGVLNACGTCGATPDEVCDGNDNDCDGGVDEGVLNACGTCGPTPVETCNGIDDDCDGGFDEGLLNACNSCGAAPTETCDGLDNDCDDRIDEGLSNCDIVCTPTGAEGCDNIDNDCDGTVDEGTRNACNECGSLPTEACDNIDNDCDGTVDEGVRNRCGDCGIEPPELCDFEDDDCDGIFDEGAVNDCGRCGVEPVEACDNVDNDCDGIVDNGATCPGDQACVNGECVGGCQAGECFNGTVCRDGVCVTPCDVNECPAGFVCSQGECSDPCGGIECGPGRACSYGFCIEAGCEVAGCPDGEVCRTGVCEPDACLNTNCGPTQGCREGTCFDTCVDVACAPGERCTNGTCRPDACAGRQCPFGEKCEDGECLTDPCAEVRCEPGEVCADGACVVDLCLTTECPAESYCVRGECIPTNPPDDQIPDDGQVGEGEGEGPGGDTPGLTPGEGTTGDEACSCTSVTQGGTPMWIAAMAALVALLAWRRL